jgi:hypothetical protein
MRGIANLRADGRFSVIHSRLDSLLDDVPVRSEHLLKADAYFAERDRSFRVIVTGGEMLHG